MKIEALTQGLELAKRIKTLNQCQRLVEGEGFPKYLKNGNGDCLCITDINATENLSETIRLLCKSTIENEIRKAEAELESL